MEWTSYVGLGIALLGFLIFLVMLLNPRFREYAGIREYKRTREKFHVNKRENAAEEHEQYNESGLNDISENITDEERSGALFQFIGKFVGMFLALYVTSTVLNAVADEIMPTLNATGDLASAEMINMTIGLFPIIALVMIFGLVIDFYNHIKGESNKTIDTKKGEKEYKRVRKKYTKNKR